MISTKTKELARFLLGRTGSLDFAQPSVSLKGDHDLHLRSRILSLSTKEARELDIPKSTLSDLRKRARSAEPFKVYRKIADKLRTENLPVVSYQVLAPHRTVTH